MGIKSIIKISYTNCKTYCLKWKRDTENVDLKVIKTKNSRTILLSKCAVCDSKKSRFMNEQEVKGY